MLLLAASQGTCKFGLYECGVKEESVETMMHCFQNNLTLIDHFFSALVIQFGDDVINDRHFSLLTFADASVTRSSSPNTRGCSNFLFSCFSVDCKPHILNDKVVQHLLNALYHFLSVYLNTTGREGIPQNFRWGCAARTCKPVPNL